MEIANIIHCDRSEFFSELMKTKSVDRDYMLLEHHQFNFNDGLSLKVKVASSRHRCLVSFEL